MLNEQENKLGLLQENARSHCLSVPEHGVLKANTSLAIGQDIQQ